MEYRTIRIREFWEHARARKRMEAFSLWEILGLEMGKFHSSLAVQIQNPSGILSRIPSLFPLESSAKSRLFSLWKLLPALPASQISPWSQTWSKVSKDGFSWVIPRDNPEFIPDNRDEGVGSQSQFPGKAEVGLWGFLVLKIPILFLFPLLKFAIPKPQSPPEPSLAPNKGKSMENITTFSHFFSLKKQFGEFRRNFTSWKAKSSPETGPWKSRKTRGVCHNVFQGFYEEQRPNPNIFGGAGANICQWNGIFPVILDGNINIIIINYSMWKCVIIIRYYCYY